jgi:Calx-beta domain
VTRRCKATILDDEPRIHVTGVVVFPEGDQARPILLAVNLSAPSSQTVTVSYATADGSASAGSDYLPAAGALTFHPGETRKTIALTLPGDKTQEPIVEAFFANLSGASSNAVILRRGVVHIVDDDNNRGHHHGYGAAPAAAVAASWAGGAAALRSNEAVRPTPGGTPGLGGWGWVVDPKPSDSEILTPGNQGEEHRTDRRTVPRHQTGHPLGREHDADGLMAPARTASTQQAVRRGGGADTCRFAADALFALLGAEEEAAWIGTGLVGRGRSRR